MSLVSIVSTSQSFLRGLRFALLDPHKLIRDQSKIAAANGQEWFEMLLGGRRMVVFFTKQAAMQVVNLPSQAVTFFQGPAMHEWIGTASPIMLAGDEHFASRGIAAQMMARWTVDEYTDVIYRAVASSRRGKFDVGPMVRRAALEWGVRGIAAHSNQPWDQTTVDAAVAWFDAADSIGALWPDIRPLTGWHRQRPARTELIRRLGLEHPFGDPDQCKLYQDTALTVLLGCLNLTMVAMDAWLIAHRSGGRVAVSDAYAEALKTPPLSLLVREAVGQLKIAGATIEAGEGLAIATSMVELPFGGGEHACLDRKHTRLFTQALFRAFHELGLRPHDGILRKAETRRHMHCSHGIVTLDVIQEKI